MFPDLQRNVNSSILHVPLKPLRIPIRPHGVSLQKSAIFVVIDVRISSLTQVSRSFSLAIPTGS
jgi:hypothetical protein